MILKIRGWGYSPNELVNSSVATVFACCLWFFDILVRCCHSTITPTRKRARG